MLLKLTQPDGVPLHVLVTGGLVFAPATDDPAGHSEIWLGGGVPFVVAEDCETIAKMLAEP